MITEIYKVDQKYFKDKEDAFREAIKKNFAVITLNLIEEMKRKEKYYEATIKWSDNGNIEDGKILKIGDIGEDDDNIFFYLESEEELKSFKNIGHHEWTIIEVTEIIN